MLGGIMFVGVWYSLFQKITLSVEKNFIEKTSFFSELFFYSEIFDHTNIFIFRCNIFCLESEFLCLYKQKF